MHYWGKHDQTDGWDVIEHLAAMPWSNGKVGMAGNSWLAISQWHIASARPPHLAAIAPWEGMSDGYRDQHRRGGIPSPSMVGFISAIVPSNGLLEDAGTMAEQNPLWNDYWDDKKVDLAQINIPTYVVASYSSKFHVSGTFRGYKNISSGDKWLRVNATQEWYDFLHAQDDLLKFFDYFLKGLQNDWRSTPPVRLSLLGHNLKPIINKPYNTYPPPEAVHTKVYLDAETLRASSIAPKQAASKGYRADSDEKVHFDLIFDKPTVLAGYPTLHLYLQCNDHDDMDIFVMLRKLDKTGREVDHVNYPISSPIDSLYKTNITFLQGPSGKIRASHRATAESRETYPGEVFHPHTTEQKISPGTIVPLHFSTWPIGTIYEPGEAIRVVVSGYDLSYPESVAVPTDPRWNKGVHIVHTGGNYRSYISLPVIS